MADRRDLRQRVIVVIENGSSASEAGRRCHVPLKTAQRCSHKFEKSMGSFKDSVLQDARVVRQGKRTKLFAEFMKRTRSALRIR